VALQTMTLHMPDALYDRFKQRAAHARRSVEEELLDVLAAAVPVTRELPAGIADALSPLALLALLDDEALWRAARSPLAVESAVELEALRLKRQREGLTDSEAETAAALVRHYERAMLVRAQAAALLKERGYDVAELVAGE
jgi:plasmid stability protein